MNVAIAAIPGGPMATARGLAVGARFFGMLPVYLRRRVSSSEAKALIRKRLLWRGQRLVDRLRVDVFGRKGSVYHRLMVHAGCELGDVEKEVAKEGVEGALGQLLRAGVYLTVEEFKGRAAVKRGSLRLEVAPEQLRSPRAAYHLAASSGGSRSAGTPVMIDLRFVRACAANLLACLEAWGGETWVKAIWETPGAAARFRLTEAAMSGDPPAAWFTST